MNKVKWLIFSLLIFIASDAYSGLRSLGGPHPTFSPKDWCPATTCPFRAVWRFDEASGARTSDDDAACGATACDLTCTSGVSQNTAYVFEGSASADISHTDSDNCSCTDGNCGGSGLLDKDLNENWTWGIAYRFVTGNVIVNHFGKTAASSDGWYLASVFSSPICRILDAGTPTDSQAGRIGAGNYRQITCVMDEDNNQIKMYSGGNLVGTPTSATGTYSGNTGSVVFNTSPNTFTGQLDEAFVIAHVLTEEEICRICACGIAGEMCACDARDQRMYATCTQDSDCGGTAKCSIGTHECTGNHDICEQHNNTVAGTDFGTCPLPACDAPVPGILPTDWSGSFITIWSLDEATGSTRVASSASSCGTAGTDCNLTETGTVLFDPGPSKQEGDGSARYNENGSNTLSCADVTCDELDFTSGGSFTAGCWIYPQSPETASDADIFDNESTNAGYSLDRGITNNSVRCTVGDAGGAVTAESATNAVQTLDTWYHATCQYDNTANAIQVYVDGATSGSSATQDDIAADTAAFNLGRSVGGSSPWSGLLDECFVTSSVLTSAQICRICSCQIDGSLCRCDPDSPTAYSDSGRNTSECGSCSLPSCNAAAP